MIYVCDAEVIILRGGETVLPLPIENRVLTELPFLSHVVVVGNNRPYLTCLMTISVCPSLLYTLPSLWLIHSYITLARLMTISLSVMFSYLTFLLTVCINPCLMFCYQSTYVNPSLLSQLQESLSRSIMFSYFSYFNSLLGMCTRM